MMPMLWAAHTQSPRQRGSLILPKPDPSLAPAEKFKAMINGVMAPMSEDDCKRPGRRF